MSTNTPNLASRLPDVGTTIFTVMSQMAAEHDAINLSQGFPDFSPPGRLLELVDEYMRKGMNQYAPMMGVPALRERIAEKIQNVYGARVDPDGEITVTSGATEAIFVAIQAVVRRGEQVILFDPAYDCYQPAVDLAGGVSVRLPLLPPNYGIDWDRLESAVNMHTRLIIINTPHNPTGSLLDDEDLDRLAAMLRNTDTLVLSDEVYEHIVFDGHRHYSFAAHEELRERTFAISSFGKTYHNTGWKIGYCVAPPTMTTELRKVHQFVTFCTCTPMQYALADFMEDASHYLELPEFYEQKRDAFRGGLEGSRFDVLPCKGTYFQLLGYDNISEDPDTEMARWLTTQVGVAAIPVSVFYHDQTDTRVLRFCFAKDESTLQKATALLKQL